jgi:hypothetical protein
LEIKIHTDTVYNVWTVKVATSGNPQEKVGISDFHNQKILGVSWGFPGGFLGVSWGFPGDTLRFLVSKCTDRNPPGNPQDSLVVKTRNSNLLGYSFRKNFDGPPLILGQ